MQNVWERWKNLKSQTIPYQAVRRDRNELFLNGNPNCGSGTQIIDASFFGFHDNLIFIQAGRGYTKKQTVSLHREEFTEIIAQFTTPEMLRELADKMEGR